LVAGPEEEGAAVAGMALTALPVGAALLAFRPYVTRYTRRCNWGSMIWVGNVRKIETDDRVCVGVLDMPLIID
jgi:hypothetical protein